ncbi:cellulose binding domain-containing protein [Microbispora hainanensis]|uniref:cellulose binding domain-containing protein n=1 Tax=Microbispora hainanensis TaxID=568844 RepID=UPI002E298E8E|nr:cellulose binding domain-containing protein [Microbispora hainanensis]
MSVRGLPKAGAVRAGLLGAGLLGAGLALAASTLPPAFAAASAVAGDTTPPSAPGTLYHCPLPAPPGADFGIGVSLCWGAATDDVGVTGYDIQVKQDGAFTTIRTTTGTGLPISGLTLGQSYTFRVIARDAAGNAGPPSNEVTQTANYLSGAPPTSPPPSPTPIDRTPPTRPEGLGPYNVYLNGAAGLTWTRSTDNVAVTGYDVYAWIDGAFRKVPAQVSDRPDGSVLAIVGDLTPGRDYLFYVVAKDAAGNLSAPSDLVRQRAMVEPPSPSPSPGTGTDTIPPGTPTGLTAASGMPIPGGIFLTWNAVSDDSRIPPKYDLFRRTDHGYAYEGENATPRDIVVGLEGGKSYTFQVVARDAAGNLSNPSAPYTAVATPDGTSSPSPSPSPSPSGSADTTPPSAPTGLWVCGADFQNAVPMCWTASTDDTGVAAYDVYMKQGADFVKIGSTTSTLYIAEGLVAGTSYTFYVVARDAAGNTSEPSNTLTATAQSGLPTFSPSPSPSPSPSVSPSSGIRCKVTYAANDWGTGFTTNITINNTGTTTINGWTLAFTFAGNQKISPPGWSATWTQTGNSVTAANFDWNKTIKPGESVQIGFQGTYTGSNPTPTAFTLNGTTCS